MKELILKVRVILTNICRTIYSFLFVNLIISNGKVLGANFAAEDSMLTCYGVEATLKPPQNNYKIFFIIVPIVLIITGVGTFIAIKKHKKNKENKEDDKKG